MSFDFEPPARRRQAESIVPMINVVFLLLIFFLMTSSLMTPPPFDVSVPRTSQGDAVRPAPIIYLSVEGDIAFEQFTGQAAITALASAVSDGASAQLRADAMTEAGDVARALRALTSAGVTDIDLVVAPE